MLEFAFIGRSNVGKSSLLNMLSGKPRLARVSPTPGFTKLINVFTINKTWRLVDLPGYGFAHVAREDRTRFNEAVLNYLKHRENLCCVFALIDSSIAPQAIDLEFVQWLTSNSIPFVLVFTKIDTAKPQQVQENMAAFTDRIAGWYEQLPQILACSSTTREGRRELLEVIEKSLAEQGIERAAPEQPSLPAADLPEEMPAPGWKVWATSTKPRKRATGTRPW